MSQIAIRRGRYSTLPYRKTSAGKFADLRGGELRVKIGNGRTRFVRLSVNGQYRRTEKMTDHLRYGNPGRDFKFGPVLIDWTHFRRHCWHVSVNVRFFRERYRGITLSYGYSF